jgi:hypothetical protein
MIRLLWSSPRVLPVVTFASLLVGAGCSSTPDESATAHKAKHDLEITHEACDTASSSAQRIDVNGDGRPDIIHVMSGGKEVCRVVDLNMDGRPDVFIYYDDAGNERRRESDFDRDGRPDEIDVFKNGVVVEKDREMNFDGKLDTWDTYQEGPLVKRERDTNADGIVDQWWDFYDASDPKCAIVSNDVNQDGEPDPQTAVDLCKEAQPLPPLAPMGSSSSAPSASAPIPPPPPPPAPTPPPPPPPPAPTPPPPPAH